MTSHLNTKPPMRNVTASSYTGQATANGYAPSVPISVYRELAAELQATRAMLDSLNNQNQNLAKQNQQLRTEVDKVVQSALQLQKVAGSQQPLSRSVVAEVAYARPDIVVEPSYFTPEPARSMPRSFNPRPEPAEPTVVSEKLFTEQAETRPRRSPQGEQSPELGGFWLAAVIFLIVVSAFGAGFLIVRPFLPSR
ncbi:MULTISPECIES: hypothetical protein [Trichocoleus]|uniref:hypothetical protein n=1 Tax=Trichocoleus TaxID=450526 RepID=UPI001689FE44|nr:hypothetical protein [Trichocoleus sp. FACHB-262]MBD2119620.1 hypothetical protein [Trichocoleus sp. FACHB-262]